MMNITQAKEKLAAYGQTHLLRWYDDLAEYEQEALLDQIEELDTTLLDVFSDFQKNKIYSLSELTCLKKYGIMIERYFR